MDYKLYIIKNVKVGSALALVRRHSKNRHISAKDFSFKQSLSFTGKIIYYQYNYRHKYQYN